MPAPIAGSKYDRFDAQALEERIGKVAHGSVDAIDEQQPVAGAEARDQRCRRRRKARGAKDRAVGVLEVLTASSSPSDVGVPRRP